MQADALYTEPSWLEPKQILNTNDSQPNAEIADISRGLIRGKIRDVRDLGDVKSNHGP